MVLRLGQQSVESPEYVNIGCLRPEIPNEASGPCVSLGAVEINGECRIIEKSYEDVDFVVTKHTDVVLVVLICTDVYTTSVAVSVSNVTFRDDFDPLDSGGFGNDA